MKSSQPEGNGEKNRIELKFFYCFVLMTICLTMEKKIESEQLTMFGILEIVV